MTPCETVFTSGETFDTGWNDMKSFASLSFKNKIMNKITLTFLIVMGSQILSAQNLILGASAGGNFSRFKFDKNQDLDQYWSERKFTPGLNGGIRVGYNFTPSIGIIAGVDYMEKGSELGSPKEVFEDLYGIRSVDNQGNLIQGFYNWTEKMRYISVPLLVRWQSGGKEGGFTLSAGISFNAGFYSRSNRYFESPLLRDIGFPEGIYTDYPEIEQTFGSNVVNEYRSWQPDLIFAPGYMFKINENSRLTATVGIDSGLGDSFNKKWKSLEGPNSRKTNRTVFLSFGYEYHFDASEDVY